MRPEVEDVVQIPEHLPRGTLKLVRIKEIHTSSDGQIRAVSVRMPSGLLLTKAIADLSPLELEHVRKQTSPGGVLRGETLLSLVL